MMSGKNQEPGVNYMTYTKYESPPKTFVYQAPPREVRAEPAAEPVYIPVVAPQQVVYTKPVREVYTYVRESGIPGAMKCGKCNLDLPMNGTYVTANGKSFHHECFACETCNKPIRNMKYKINAGKIQCVACSSPICDACNMPVEGRQLNAEGKIYHPECFRCNKCDHPLRGEYAINPKNGDRVCLKCDAPQCTSCKRMISEGEAYHQDKQNVVRCVPCARTVAGPGPMPAPGSRPYAGPEGYYGGARGKLGPPQGKERRIPRPYDFAGYGGPAYAPPRKW